MHASNHLERIICIKEDVKSVNKLSRKIYMLALNAMLMSRRAGGAGTGYARVTRELRNFSESLEKSMEKLTKMSNSMARSTSTDTKRQRIVRIFNEAMQSSNKRNSNIIYSMAVELENDHENEYEFEDVAQHLSRLQQLCRQGHNVAVLAKVEAVHINTDSSVLLNIGDEVSTYVEQVEDAMSIAYECALKGREAA